jgi:hypothetical protein
MLGLVLAAFSVPGISCAVGAAALEPCTAATSACSEWIGLGTAGARSLVYRTFALESRSEQVTRGVIVIHGAGRDADNYFRTGVAAAFLAGALGDTLVVSPRFASMDGSCQDALAAGELSWRCGGNSWRAGGPATNARELTSFDLADEILRKLARKDVFPNLRAIVVSGHSAGGQYVQRYAMANKVHDALGVPVTYVVSNPSSYAYLDHTRPAGAEGEFRSYGDGNNCTAYNRWPYGLEMRGGYTESIADDVLKKQLVSRPVVYLLGELDTLPIAGFDSSCPAMAQGPSRYARGQAFFRYVNDRHGARHTLTRVALCGHNARCVFTAESALPVLFPRN